MPEFLDKASVSQLLATHVLDAWFPRCIDQQGGFQQNFDRSWQRHDDQSRDLVFQARMLWVTATVARVMGPARPDFKDFAVHGEQALFQFEDRAAGGWWPTTQERRYKHSYAISFVIYALAAAHRLNPDPARRQSLLSGLEWWDTHAQATDGTYWDVLDPTGAPLTEAEFDTLIPSAPALRSSNTYIHIVEALTEAVEACDSELATVRLLAHVEALEKVLLRDRGRMYESYTRDWQPADRRISFGHNIEVVTLLHRANQALERKSELSPHLTAERVMRHGLDLFVGGICNSSIWSLRGDHNKTGWAQIEAVYGFLLVAQLSSMAGDKTRARRYRAAAEKTWFFICEKLVDPLYPGIFDGTDRWGRVKNPRKGHRWKACYHYTRCLLECMPLVEN